MKFLTDLIFKLNLFENQRKIINNKNPKTPLVVSAIVLVSITGDKLNAIKENNLIFSLITLLNCSIIFLSKKIHPKPTKNPSIAKIILEQEKESTDNTCLKAVIKEGKITIRPQRLSE